MGHPIKLTRPKPECQTRIPAPDNHTTIQTGKPPHGDSTKLTRSDHRNQPGSHHQPPHQATQKPIQTTHAASHPQAAHLTLPNHNPQVKPGPKRLHTADTPHPWPTQRRKAKPHPHKTTQKPGQPRKDSVYITHPSRKNKIGLACVDIGRGHTARAWWHGVPHHLWGCWHHDTSHRDRLVHPTMCGAAGDASTLRRSRVVGPTFCEAL